MRVQENVPISSLTTMRLGGPARVVLEVGKADVLAAYSLLEKRDLKAFPLGGGANTLGRDEGFDGAIIINRAKGLEILDETAETTLVHADGGEVWDDVVKFATERQLSGIEALAGIPGNAAAAPVQNIAAYGQTVGAVLDSVEVFDTKTHEFLVLSPPDLKLSYRSTIFNTGEMVGRYFILGINLALNNSTRLLPPLYTSLQNYYDERGLTDYSPTAIRKAVLDIRGHKLPDPAVLPSAGSFFKNIYFSAEDIKQDHNLAEAVEKAVEADVKIYDEPDGIHKTINTGALIELAGLKGKLLHGFRVSEKAALILINESGKSFANLVKARAEITAAVKAKFGFEIEQEPVEIR